MPENIKQMEGRSTARTRKKMEPLLREWYGANGDTLNGAMMKYLPQPSTIGQALHAVVAKKLPAYKMKVFVLQEHWTEIVGEVTAKRTLPVRLKDGILDVEVSHPAYRAALTGKTIQAAILQKIKAVAGDDVCRELRFIPAGSRPPETIKQ